MRSEVTLLLLVEVIKAHGSMVKPPLLFLILDGGAWGACACCEQPIDVMMAQLTRHGCMQCSLDVHLMEWLPP